MPIEDNRSSFDRAESGATVPRWRPGYPLRNRHQSETVLVGDFHCSGERRGWAPEWAKHAEIALQFEGTHLFEVGARRRHLVDAATVFVHPAGEEYRRSSPTALPQRSMHLFLSGDLQEALGRARGPRVIPSSRRVALLFRQTRLAAEGLAAHEAALRLAGAVLTEISGERAVPVPPERHSWRRLAETVQQLLATGFAQRLTLETIGQSCGASPFHVSRIFRAVTGETVHRCLTRLRLRAALVELEHGPQNLAQLAMDLGFSSHSHFTAAFRREYRVVPSELLIGRRGRARIPARR